MAIRIAITLIMVSLVAGCGSLYKKDSNCPGYIETGQCRDLRETYEATHEYDRDRYRQMLRAQQDEDTPRARSRARTSGVPEAREKRMTATGYAPLMVGEEHPRPILTQAIPVRVFVDPFEDGAGRLHTPGFIYVRATEPKWIFGDRETSGSRVVTPLAPTR